MAVGFYARPVIPVTGCLILGIAGGARFPGINNLYLYLLVAFSAMVIVSGLFRKKGAWAFPLLFFLGLGYLSIQPWTAPDFPQNHVAHFVNKQKWQITGVVDQAPVRKHDALKFILEADQLETDQDARAVVGKIRVTVSGEGPGVSSGDRVRLKGSLKSIRNFNNPGGFNYRRYMAFKGVWATTYTRADSFVVLEGKRKTGSGRLMADSRGKISANIESTLKGEHREILKALITGDRTQVPPALSEAFNRAGIGHLLAISGLHIGIVATVFFVFFSWLLSRFQYLLQRAWNRKGAALLTVFPVLIYGFLAGMSPSTQRAVIMTGVFLFTFLFERDQDALNTLAAAALVILIVFPPALFSISFQLSFAAVFFILYGLSKTRRQQDAEERASARVIGRVFLFLLVSVFAIMGTLPLVMFYFNQASLVGLLSNCILVPMIGFVVVPLALVSAFVYPVSELISSMGLRAAGAVLEAAVDIVIWIAQLPFAAVKTITPSFFEIGCYYILLLAVLNLKKNPLQGRKQDTRMPAYKAAWAAAVIAAIAFAADIGYWVHERFLHRDLRVTMVDVGQGNAALLELPGGVNVLVDGGGFSNNQVFDVGAWILAPYLWQKKIKTVDTLILSHANSDHLNGLTYIAEHFNVKTVWSNNEMPSTLSCDAFLKVIQEKNIDYPAFSSIPRSQVINGVTFDILYPPDRFMRKKEKEKWRDANNNSLVTRVTFGSTSFFFPGDIMAAAEKELVRTAPDDLKSSVLLAPHHGSRTSSTDLFLDRVDPGIVVISAGWKNRFRMPHESVLKRYEARGCRVYRTDLHGALLLVSDGQGIRVEPTLVTIRNTSEPG